MASKDYQSWLELKNDINITISEDQKIQRLGKSLIGIKPQGTAVEVVGRVYCRYCQLYNKLCECYDQMLQVQRRTYIKKIIDAVTCRLLELKHTLEEVEVFQFTYPDNALQQLLITPQDIKILCPFFYPFEIREQEMQYIIDQIFAGNRLGDPTPTASQIELKELQRLEEEKIKKEQEEEELLRRLAMREDLKMSDADIVLCPEELEEIRLRNEYVGHINNIQRMERSRVVIRAITKKLNKDINTYLEFSNLKAPQAERSLRIKAAAIIQFSYRHFMEIKRKHVNRNEEREILGMMAPSWSPPSSMIQLQRVKEDRRNFRRKYHKKWVEESLKENARALLLRDGDIMEDITAEIKQWLREWYDNVRVFDEFPFPGEGGSILIIRGETFTIEEYIVWREAEDKRLKSEANAPKSKEQIKAEKLFALQEQKRIEEEEKIKEKKRVEDYKKARMNYNNDPGVYVKVGKTLEGVEEAWFEYENQWHNIDTRHASLDAIKGHIKQLIIDNAYKNVQLQLRPIVDEMMRHELAILKKSLKNDYLAAGITKPPQSQKRKRPKEEKSPKLEKVKPPIMFQSLVDKGIVRKYPRTSLDDYWGDLNYAAADMRATMWTPCFPPPCLGDVREQVRQKCLVTLGCSCRDAVRTHLIVGPKGTGKKTLIYGVASETNSILIDLSPTNLYNKYPSRRGFKKMLTYVSRISKIMQPTVIMVNDADKVFYRKIPKEEKMLSSTFKKIKKDLFSLVIKPIQYDDKILVLGAAAEPWLSKKAALWKAFPSPILIPRTDYGSISLILTKMIMGFPGVDPDFDVHSLAQVLRGYDTQTIIEAVNSVLSTDRVIQLYNKPLDPMEILSVIVENEAAICLSSEEYNTLYWGWYESYSSWGPKYQYYMSMIHSQYLYKLKADKKNELD